ncbi:Fur family transcriptional regulator [Polyangium sp. 15x6]|uniref:Fur family transcriptional regulator n=1 Tax=Polyangium sp. 15x6 TaxID=3042687 RepID=UPI00249ABE81|nr:Fur family transcriptional regulator [Polyangium sp. 15x6]MDI3286692.1 Fur family transcriptional regulator [Polyangium sp. 15x6]
MARSTDPPNIDELRSLVRNKGLRATAPRLAVLRRLLAQKTPVSHGDLCAELAPEGWDRATIYRNLIDLTEVGLVRRTDVGDHVWRFELVREGGEHDSGTHPHFVCNSCGEVACLPDEIVEVKPARGIPRALRKKGLEIQFRGTCDRCA